jgi:TonB family protein
MLMSNFRVKLLKIKRLMTGLMAIAFATACLPGFALDTSTEPLSLKQFTELLPKTFKPKNDSPRGFCTWALEPEAKENERLEIYNSSQNPAFDNETKAVLQVLLNNHRIAPDSHWHIRFTNDGKISATAGDNQISYEPFIKKMQQTIKKNWSPPKQTQNKLAKVRFKIKFDGTISNIKLVTLSDNEEYDKAALAAIVAMGKLDPLPDGAPDAVDIEFDFAYNINSPPPLKPSGPAKSALIEALWQASINNQMQKVKEENKDLTPVITPKAKAK